MRRSWRKRYWWSWEGWNHRVKQSAVYRHLMTPSWAILLITSHVPNAWKPVHVTMIDWVCAINSVAASGDKTAYALLWERWLLSAPYLIPPWLEWFGHVARRDETGIIREVVEMKIGGKRPRGRPSLRWKETVRRDMKAKEDQGGMGDWQGMMEMSLQDPLPRTGRWRRKVRKTCSRCIYTRNYY